MSDDNPHSSRGSAGKSWLDRITSIFSAEPQDISELQQIILADPQTSGGLLISIDADSAMDFERFLKENNHNLEPFGKMVKKGNKSIVVR